jgi:hypothetical protein
LGHLPSPDPDVAVPAVLVLIQFQLQPEQKGVLIRRIEPTAPVSKVLSQYDILQAFDGMEIANDGTVPFRSGERISFSYLVSQVGDNLQGV